VRWLAVRWLALSFGLWALLAASPAHAQVDWQLGLALTGNVTDNIGTADNPETGFFGTISPRFRIALERTTSAYSLEYRFAVDLYANHLDSTSYVNSLRLQSFFRFSDAIRLTLGAEGTQGSQSSLMLNRDPSATTIGVQPPGRSLHVGGTAFERLDFDLGEFWRLSQDLGVTINRPLEDDTPEHPRTLPATLAVANLLSLERRWQRDSLATEALATYTVMSYPGSGEREQQIVSALVERWRHDFSDHWSGELSGGVMLAAGLDEPHDKVWSPTGRIGAFYRREEAAVELSGGHGAEVNALVGRTFLLEDVRLRVGVPILREPALGLSGSAGYQYGHAMNLHGETTEGAVHVVLADAALDWQISPNFELSARYQFSRQSGEATTGLASFARHVGMVTLTCVYPGIGAAPSVRVPSGRSNRADGAGSDLQDEVGQARRRRAQ